MQNIGLPPALLDTPIPLSPPRDASLSATGVKATAFVVRGIAGHPLECRYIQLLPELPLDALVVDLLDWLQLKSEPMPLVGLYLLMGVSSCRMLQISTATRCILLHFPVYVTFCPARRIKNVSVSCDSYQLAKGFVFAIVCGLMSFFFENARHFYQMLRVLHDFLQLKTMIKAGVGIWSDALDIFRDLGAQSFFSSSDISHSSSSVYDCRVFLPDCLMLCLYPATGNQVRS
jgi:hypothetical protein